MPSLDHVVSVSERSRSNGERVRSVQVGKVEEKARGTKQARRIGIPVDMNSASGSLLSPFLSHLPSIPTMSDVQSFGGFFPLNKAGPSRPRPTPPDIPSATWQEADLGDGHGKRPLLLITSSRHALQIFSCPSSVIPDVSHVQEQFDPPVEVFTLPSIQYDASTEMSSIHGDGGIRRDGHETVLSATLLVDGPLWEEHGPVVALIASGPRHKSLAPLALILVSLRTGMALKRVDLGQGKTASMVASSRAVIVAISSPDPTLHVLDPTVLNELHPPISNLPAHHLSHLPVFALSGRLLAFVTNTAPSNAGPDGLGSLITAKTSPHRARPSTSDGSLDRTAADHAKSGQAVLLDSAVGIGENVARGVWAGIKYGAKAAKQARDAQIAGRLASSAPADPVPNMDDETGPHDQASEGSDTASVDDEQDQRGPRSVPKGGVWVKVVDLCPRSASKSTPSVQDKYRSLFKRGPRGRAGSHVKQASTGDLDLSTIQPTRTGPETLAHFRLPAPRSLPADPSRLRRPSPIPIGQLSFSPQGGQLLVAPQDGRTSHVFEIHPLGLHKAKVASDVKGCVWHRYELKRGNTLADISHVEWEKSERWVGLATARGTIHMFAINPEGAAASAHSHATVQPRDPVRLHPLSTVTTSSVRLHPLTSTSTSPKTESSEQVSQLQSQGSAVCRFTQLRKHPLSKAVCQDVVVFRSGQNELETVRLFLTEKSRVDKEGSRNTLTTRGANRSSGLTDMMRGAGAKWNGGSDLGVKSRMMGRWITPLGEGEEESLLVTKAKPRRPRLLPPVSSLARAEIQTHSINLRILPPSIYLSHQIDFFSARAIDEFSPLSILDPEARTKRMIFRHEVEARPAPDPSADHQMAIGSPDSATMDLQSFDEPLLTALHSIMDSPPDTQLPRLPNGNGDGLVKWQAATMIPIRQAVGGLGEGVGRVRREYVRAQHVKQKRRESEAAANRLSFEEDVVFPSSLEAPTASPTANGALEADKAVISTASPSSHVPGSYGERIQPQTALEPGSLNSDGAPTGARSESSASVSASGSGSGSGSGLGSQDTPAEGSEGPEGTLEGWTEEWEEEYAKAVEDDGAPEELVLGLLDEEEEERRKWMRKRELMKKEWARRA